MRVLLLCSYRALDDGEVALGLERDENGKTLIDAQIEKLLAMDMQVTCVLAGVSADEQLRQCPRLAETDMVFDTANPLNLLSNAREGAASAPHEACFVLPVEVPAPAKEVWDFLRTAYSQVGYQTETSVLQAVVPSQGAPWHFGFPLLFTFQGTRNLQDNDDLCGLVDARLKYLQLAPDRNAL